MTTAFISTLAINLGVLLAISWLLGAFICYRLLKDKQQVQTAPANSPTTAPTKKSHPGKDAKDLANTTASLSHHLKATAQQLTALTAVQAQQQLMIEGYSASPGAEPMTDLLKNHEKAQVIINQLQADLHNSQETLKPLLSH